MASTKRKSGLTASDLVFVGIKGFVVAIKKLDGSIVWSTRMDRGLTFVPVIVEGELLLALSGGELSCLEATTGKLLWHNPLKGYGTNLATLATSSGSSSADQQASAAISAAACAAAAGAAAASAAAAS